MKKAGNNDVFDDLLYHTAIKERRELKEAEDEERRRAKKKRTIDVLRNELIRRNELLPPIDHICTIETCNSRNCSSFFSVQNSHMFELNIYICKYGRIHECDECELMYDSIGRLVCPVTHVERQELSFFEKRNGQVTRSDSRRMNTKDVEMLLEKTKQKELGIKQIDEGMNIDESEVTTTERVTKSRVNKPRAMSTGKGKKKIVNSDKRLKPTPNPIILPPNEYKVILKRMCEYLSGDKALHGMKIVDPNAMQIVKDITIEKVMISTGEISLSKMIKKKGGALMNYIEAIEAIESCIRLVVPGVHRFYKEEVSIVSDHASRRGFAVDYIYKCYKNRKVVSLMKLYYKMELGLDKYECMLSHWCDWKDWVTLVDIVLHWYFIYEHARNIQSITPGKKRIITLDYTQLTLVVLYSMRDSLEKKDPSGLFENILIPIHPKVSLLNWVLSVNKLNSYGISRSADNLGTKILKECLEVIFDKYRTLNHIEYGKLFTPHRKTVIIKHKRNIKSNRRLQSAPTAVYSTTQVSSVLPETQQDDIGENGFEEDTMCYDEDEDMNGDDIDYADVNE